MALKLIRPLDCIIKKVEENEKLNTIVETINDTLLEQYQLNQNVTIKLSSDLLTMDDQWLLKTFFKKCGWKITISKRDNLYTFILSED